MAKEKKGDDRRVEKILADTLAEMERNRQVLLMRYPFVGSVMMHLEFVPTLDDPRIQTAATDGRRVFADCKFYGRLKPSERLFVLAHEAWHCILLHFAREQKRNQEIFNVATDLEIHFLLMDEGMKEPFVLPHEPEWKGLSAEEIYEQLLESDYMQSLGIKFESEKEEALWKNACRAAGFDGHIYVGNDGLTKEEAARRTEAIRRAVIQAAQHVERIKGSLPEHLASLVEHLRKPELDWRELLRQFVTTAFGDERRWLPPARRYVSYDLYLPSRRTETLNAVLAVDTSRSTMEDLPQFFTELSSLLHTFGDYQLTVIQCDVEVQRVDEFTGETPLPHDATWMSFGGGGTSFVPPFEYAKQNDLNPDVFIYFTDGYGDPPEQPPRYPVMWVLSSDGTDEHLPWGAKIRLGKSSSEAE